MYSHFPGPREEAVAKDCTINVTGRGGHKPLFDPQGALVQAFQHPCSSFNAENRKPLRHSALEESRENLKQVIWTSILGIDDTDRSDVRVELHEYIKNRFRGEA
jgi:hypothetical protein